MWYPVIYLAIIGAQGRFVGSNPAYKGSDLRRLLQCSEAKFLIIDSRQLDDALPTALEIGIDTNNIFLLDEYLLVPHRSALKSWRSLLRFGEEDWYTPCSSQEGKITPAVQLLTSGTSGLPKLAIMSHYGILVQAMYAAYMAEECPEQVGQFVKLSLFYNVHIVDSAIDIFAIFPFLCAPFPSSCITKGRNHVRNAQI